MSTDTDPRPLTRRELSEFLPSQRAVRAFEQLFDVIPNDVNSLQSQLNDVEVVAGTATAIAQQAISLLQQITEALEQLVVRGDVEDYYGEEDTVLNQRLEIGSIAAQSSDDVEISGGTITAKLSDDTAILLRSSTSLSDASGANSASLTNSPVAGNPTKWVAIDDNGVTRYIPTW